MSQYGVGTIDTWKLASGRERYRARAFADGKHTTIKICDTREEAEAALAGAAEARSSGDLKLEGETLRTFGEAFLARRKLNGGKNGKTDTSRWNLHIASAPFASFPLAKIQPIHVAKWIDDLAKRRAADKRGKRKIGAQTIRHCVALLRRALQLALNRGLVSINAAEKHELPQVSAEEWTYLLPAEIERLTTCEAIPIHDRLCIQFAIGAGLRQGEQWNLELADLHVGEDEEHPHAIVRYGKPPGWPGGRKPKNGKVRRVELFGIALAAARAWLPLLPAFAERNPAGLVWPTARGARRRDGKAPRGWNEAFFLDPAEKLPRGVAKTTVRAKRKMLPTYLEAAGLADGTTRHDGRGVRWHDLRHTCGAALISGWWGRRWRLEEVKEQLGHKSTKITERYAHLAPGVLAEAARATGKKKGTER